MRKSSFNCRWGLLISPWLLGLLIWGFGFGVDAQGFNAGKGSLAAFLIEDLGRAEVLSAQNEDQLMVPASALKAATSAMALELLGPGFRFTTDYFVSGRVEAGVLYGDLLVKGVGDPTLGSAYFPETSPEKVLHQLQQDLKAKGIQRITGDILLDLSLYEGEAYPDGRLWEDMANYYGAAPSALSWRDNSFDLLLRSPSETGARVTVISHTIGFEAPDFSNSVVAAANSKDSAYIYGHPSSNQWAIRGSIPAGRSSFRIRGALPQPAMEFGLELKQRFGARDVVLLAQGQDDLVTYRKAGSWQSPPLLDVLRVINQRSNNLMADHVFLECARQQGKSWQWTDAREVFLNFWASRTPVEGLRIKDGSGLSPLNLVPANFLNGVLKYMYHSPHYVQFRSTLAVGGVSGTLRGMWTSPETRGHIFAKSGSMQGTMAYCGYLFGLHGEALSFVVMVDRFSSEEALVRNSIEAFVAEWLKPLRE